MPNERQVTRLFRELLRRRYPAVFMNGCVVWVDDGRDCARFSWWGEDDVVKCDAGRGSDFGEVYESFAFVPELTRRFNRPRTHDLLRWFERAWAELKVMVNDRKKTEGSSSSSSFGLKGARR